ncbi:hypothetical protein BKA57DRAFT_492636 [Linnemannia elongata]|nr:hypothetical protein BKA57DRAFT_492636 [Linnemannia elongata]
MTRIEHLPEEIYLLIAKHLTIRSLHSCIRTCRSFYSSFIPHLWSHINLSTLKLKSAIPPAHIRTNAHHIESISVDPALTEEYYNIVFPRLQELRMGAAYDNATCINNMTVKPPQKILFVRRHPFVRKLVYHHKDLLPKEFWEVVGAEWTGLEVLEFAGTVEEGVEEAFWGVCDRVQDLTLNGVDFSGHNNALAILSTLSFIRLCRLEVVQQSYKTKDPYRLWPLRLLERVKRSEKLKRLVWNVDMVAFPIQMVLDAFKEVCWPELCELCTGSFICSEEGMARILTGLPSRKLASLERSSGKFSSLTFDCLRDHYFDHLRELKLGGAPVSLARWSRRLCRLLELNLERDPHYTFCDDESRSDAIMDLETLDLRLTSSSNSGSNSDRNDSTGSCKNGGSGGVRNDIRCWSSLTQLRDFSFDGDRRELGMDELIWMIENWRDLRVVTGEFKAIKGDEERARRDCILLEAELAVVPNFHATLDRLFD